MYLARKGAPRTLAELWRPLGLLTCAFAGLILLQPDLGTTISLVLMLAGMLVVAGVPARTLAAAGGIAVTIGLAAIWIEPYRRARVLSFLDPWQDAQGAGFQNVQAIIGMGSGGLTGEGLGQGVQKINYLPEAHTDMIFAIVGEELGLVGTTAVIAAFGAFAFAGFTVALRCRNPFGKLVAAGVTSLVCGQAAVNLAAVMGVAPLTGIPLPFVSYGGSSLVILLGAVGILLNIATDERAPSKHRKSGLRCLIAAGGTAGHVLPSLAVAEALRERGVEVTFAGSPDRVEAELVPQHGYAFDSFRVAGFPRRPSLALLRSLLLAAKAPSACLAILRRRRPHVVLGGGGYVAGPMVLAARLRRIPAALTEADAHLGLANRLAAPFAHRVFLAYELAGLTPPKYRVTGRPVPLAHRGAEQAESRQLFGLPPDRPVLAFFGALAGARSLNDFAVERFGTAGPAVLHVSGARDFDRLRPLVARDDYVLVPTTPDFGAALAAPDLAISRAGGTVWELAAAGTPSILVPYPHATGDHQTLNARHFERGGGAIVVPEARAGASPGARRGAAGRPRPARGDAGGDARDGSSGRRRRDRRGADRACTGLKAARRAPSGRSTAAGSGSSGSAARASRRMPSSRGRGARRSAAGIESRRRISARSKASHSSWARSPSYATAGRSSSRRRTPSRRRAGRVPSSSPSSSRSSVRSSSPGPTGRRRRRG